MPGSSVIDERLSAGALRFTPPKLREAEAIGILEAHYGLSGTVEPLIGERDQNFHVIASDGGHFVLKISSPDEPDELVDFQVEALEHLAAKDPGIDVPGNVRTRAGELTCIHRDRAGVDHWVRLLTWLPGIPLTLDPAPSLGTFHRIGDLQGRVCLAFQGFRHPAATRFMPWDTMNALAMSPGLRRDHLPPHLCEKCEKALERIGGDVLPRLAEQPAQIIHNDVHAGNLLCDPEDREKMTGILDFGDMVERPLVIDLATSIASLADRAPDPASAAATLVAGFEQHLALPDGQAECLFDTVLLRAILTYQLVSFQLSIGNNPEEVRRRILPESLAALELWLATDRDRFNDRLANRDPGLDERDQTS